MTRKLVIFVVACLFVRADGVMDDTEGRGIILHKLSTPDAGRASAGWVPGGSAFRDCAFLIQWRSQS